jgi:hypothetical protein
MGNGNGATQGKAYMGMGMEQYRAKPGNGAIHAWGMGMEQYRAI